MTRRKYVVGNWKMHGVSSDLGEIHSIAAGSASVSNVDTALCLPATLIERAARSVSILPIGGQDVHWADKGAHTGCISAAMLLDAGAKLTIVGHSERREGQHETNEDVRRKAEAALAAGLGVILCIGESLGVREAGQAVGTVQAQLDESLPHAEVSAAAIPGQFAIAYEPIWAIGTGKVASPADIGEMHSALRDRLVAAYGDAGNEIRILYGGSVNASNAAEIFAVDDVDGALVGGASLTAEKFLPIVQAASAA
ncbi:triose-phosphate isomerase [Sphingomonas daechungensis]|uniref:triose-phosphate isomerase n=1 Tax=Sphingomonas daechungensis TaxID=1176646 RepID=UPI003782F06C